MSVVDKNGMTCALTSTINTFLGLANISHGGLIGRSLLANKKVAKLSEAELE